MRLGFNTGTVQLTSGPGGMRSSAVLRHFRCRDPASSADPVVMRQHSAGAPFPYEHAPACSVDTGSDRVHGNPRGVNAFLPRAPSDLPLQPFHEATARLNEWRGPASTPSYGPKQRRPSLLRCWRRSRACELGIDLIDVATIDQVLRLRKDGLGSRFRSSGEAVVEGPAKPTGRR